MSPRSLICCTLATLARRAASRPMAVMSAGLTVPLSRAMTTRTGVWFGSWNGAASRAAARLGLLVGSRSVLFSLMTLASDGRSRLARMVAATQAATTGQRNRTANRPVAAKNIIDHEHQDWRLAALATIGRWAIAQRPKSVI